MLSPSFFVDFSQLILREGSLIYVCTPFSLHCPWGNAVLLDNGMDKTCAALQITRHLPPNNTKIQGKIELSHKLGRFLQRKTSQLVFALCRGNPGVWAAGQPLAAPGAGLPKASSGRFSWAIAGACRVRADMPPPPGTTAHRFGQRSPPARQTGNLLCPFPQNPRLPSRASAAGYR